MNLIKRKRFLRLGEPPDFFKKDFLCEDREIYRMIREWLSYERWETKDFRSMFTEAKIKIPVKINGANLSKRTFECTDANGYNYQIELLHDEEERKTSFQVLRGFETTTYIVNRNYKRLKPRNKLERVFRHYDAVGKKITSKYYTFYCEHKVQIDGGYQLEIAIELPIMDSINEFFSYDECLMMETYLLGVGIENNALEIFTEFLKKIGYTETEVNASENILVKWTKNRKVTSMIQKRNGKTQQIAIQEGDKIYELSRNGSWRYTDPATEINFVIEGKGKYAQELMDCKLKGKANIYAAKTNELLDDVFSKIESMRKWITD